jgi:hypothetical protein
MKSALQLCCSALLLLTLASCTVHSQYIKTDDQGQVTRLKRSFEVDAVRYSIDAELTSALTLDNTGNRILALPEQSYVRIHSTKDNLDFVLERRQADTESELRVHGKVVGDSEQSRRQIEQLTLIMFRHTPIDAKGRVNTLLQYQGTTKVLHEISLMQDLESKKQYFNELVKQAVLTEQQQLQLIASTSTIQSDYELTELMLLLAQAQSMQPQVQKALLQTSMRINSDYEKRRLLSQLAQPPSGFPLDQILQASGDIGSDYELGQLLQQAAPQIQHNDSLQALLSAAQSIESDYELQQVLTALPFERFSTTQNEQVIALAAATIESDYELATMLSLMLSRASDPQALQSAIKAALKTISSDSEKVRVFELLHSA